MSDAHAGHGSHGSTKAILAAMVANLGIALAKFVGFLLTSSAAMLAESVHSVADTTNQVLLLIGGKKARKPADAEHPYGYGREQYVWAGLVSLLLFGMGGVFALYEGIHKVTQPSHEEGGFTAAIVILVAAVGLESWSLLTAVREARPMLDGRTWRQFIAGAKNPELPTVLLEDTGAVIGLLLALGGVVTAHVTGDTRWDGAGSIAIGALLCVIAAVLATEVKHLLVGETISDADMDAISAAAATVPGVDYVGLVRGVHLSGEQVLVDVKVKFADHLTARDVASLTDDIERAIRDVVPTAGMLFVESWLDDGTGAPASARPGAR
ncbi:MAG: cation diffusion facilitator family transporter [Ilumatobacteraceae bacterium]